VLLAQALFEDRFQGELAGDGFGGLARAQQVAHVERIGLLARHARRHPSGLLVADGVEADVHLPLEAKLPVHVCFAVPDQQQFRHAPHSLFTGLSRQGRRQNALYPRSTAFSS
jgi:hypothetical protein